MMDEEVRLLGSPDGDYNRGPAKLPQFIAGMISCLGPFVFGYCLGYSSPTLEDLEKEGILDTKSKQSWFGSLVTIGAILGGPIAGLLVGRQGRKFTIMTSCIPFTLGWCLMVVGGKFPHFYEILYVARILCGIGTGMISLCVPLYIGEIATKEVRGMLGAGFQLSVTLGILCVYGLGLVLSWRWLALVGSISSVMLLLLMLLIPETPHFWLSVGDTTSALSSLVWLRGPHVDVEIECQDIARTLENQQGSFNLRELSNRGIYIPLLLSLALMFFQQMSGVNAIIFYGGSIFSEAGFNGKPNVAALIVASVQFGATFISCLLMDCLGRRILLLFAGVFMCASEVILGVYYLKFQHDPSLNWIPLVCLNVFIISFSLGWGPIPWLILGEIFPDRVKGFASGVASMTNWLLAFLVTKFFSTLQVEITQYGTFWLFAGVCLVGVVFVAFGMPETKGKTLEEIQQVFQRRSSLSINGSDNEQPPIVDPIQE